MAFFHLVSKEESPYAKRAGVPPVCQKRIVSDGLKYPFLIISIIPPMARPVYTGSRSMPSKEAVKCSASCSSGPTTPYPAPV